MIDTDPSRPTYGMLVDPTGGPVPYPEDTRSPKGTIILPNNANRRDISDWTINPVDGRLYAITNAGSFQPFHLVSYDPASGAISDHGVVSGGGIQSGGTVGFGAIFIDVLGDIYVYNNQQGYLYRIDGNTATRVSTTSLPSSNNVDGALCVKATVPFPVRLTQFEVTQNEGSANLTWTTASESENKGFEIEKSSDAKTWKSIGFVQSRALNGNSEGNHTYTFTDPQPGYGYNYYRLKQIDLDGSFEYSMIRVLVFGKKNTPKALVFPNPANTYVSIGELKGNEKIHVYDATGRKVRSVTSLSSVAEISMEGLHEGVYHVQIIGEYGELSTHKIIKTN